MMDDIALDILSPKGTVFSGNVSSVALPGRYSPFVVLKGHAPMISSLSEGRIRYSFSDGNVRETAVSGGFVRVRDNKVTVCIE